MTTINDLAWQLTYLLADTATALDTESPYRAQADLMEALGINSVHTMSDVVSRAAITCVPEQFPGYAIMRSDRWGYRLADEASRAEHIEERGRLRATRTKLLRVATVESATNNGPMSRMVGEQLAAFVATVIDPILSRMDEIIAEAV